MKKFTKKYNYNECSIEELEKHMDSCCRNKMDEEVRRLCDAMNALPGIETSNSCCGHGAQQLSIFFKVTDSKQGLFFLTRCVDRRYWKYGYLWNIKLSVGDMCEENGELPIMYHLNSGPIVDEDAYIQAQNLVENMESHLNHKGFLKGYEIDLKKFDL